ncbi:ABC transporter substrate-binding protein [Aromatoleum toluclasticum]|uniref:ABC transporter substrate-binding protein n=1 Tax=Aromatoleum toluclasticum TaxID=92003 RepID=UPI001D187038|nr:ABC transporter substrate-binding protein [Aromatoleum toluclasticum]MCC4118208.1 ABC transporter substrate-binding protein [Aromatoleum toluclasticum]
MKTVPNRAAATLATLLALSFAGPAAAQIKVGITISTTGPAASLGMPEKNTATLFPKEIAGQKVEYIVLDDASDPSTATRNARRFVDEDKVDVIIGSTISPNSLAMIDVAAEKGTPMISIAGASRIVEPMDAKRKWVFKTPQHDSLMAEGIIDHFARSGGRSLAIIAQSDAYGDGWLTELQKHAGARDVKIVSVERYNRADTSVTAQALKVMAAKPQAVVIVGAGTPAALPQKTLRERAYGGPVYQTHGVANNDFLRVGGKDVEGTILPAGPVLVAAQLPESPVKAAALDYVRRYEEAFGDNTVTTFGAHAWDAMLLLRNAVPTAFAKGKAGTPEFRSALRDALEATKNLTVSHGVMTMTPDDHNGMDARSRVMAKIEKGRWVLIPDGKAQ